jgi:hypothetical protein
MQEDFIKDQARKFAIIVHRGASKYYKLNELKDRLEKELFPYDEDNAKLFLIFWKGELDRLFYDHLQKCDKEDCVQNKTSKNANFLMSQFIPEEKMNSTLAPLNPSNISDHNDLNYYFNVKNIPNQELVFETYNYFHKGPGKVYFSPLEFLNLLNWHYRYIKDQIETPIDVLKHFQNLSSTKDKKHILIAFVLKWYGGYPIKNMNAQFNTTLKFLEAEYLEEIESTRTEFQELVNVGLLGKNLTEEQNQRKIELGMYLEFLNNLDNIINNRERTQKLKDFEKMFNQSPNRVQDENVVQKNVELLIFISHSSKDEEIVKLFTDKILQLALQINLSNIFCTSIQATSITTGEDFRSVIKDNLSKASHVIQIISSNYKASEVCLNEMGAAWVLNNKVIPFILTPINYDSVGFIHQPHQLLKLNDENDLLKFVDEMKGENKRLKHSEIKRHVTDFMNRLNEITDKK